MLKLLALLPMVLLAGCAATNNPAVYHPQAPMAENFEPSYQKQLNASAHWEAIADDMSTQLLAALQKHHLTDKPIFLNLYSEKTEFTKAFHDFLTTRLVKKGVLVSKNKIGNTIYNYKVQAIHYKSNRSTVLPSQLKWTSLAAGVTVVREIAEFLDADKDLITAGLAADMWFGELAPKLELIITSSILSHDIYLYRTTDVYYANNSDMHLYQSQSKVLGKVFDDPFYDLR